MNMELTELQKTLIHLMKEHGVVQDQVVGSIMFLEGNEKGMEELKEYIEQNDPTAHEIITKSVEICSEYHKANQE